jgi:LPXTG-motif cell wall-anchored protein
MFKKILAAIAVTAGLLLAAPAAANAVDYTNGAQCTFDVSVAQAGGNATLICIPGTWSPGEAITWTVTGQNGSSFTLASFHSAASSLSFTKHSNGDGSDVLSVKLPAGATGTYSIVGVGQTSGHQCSASLTVLPADQSSTVLDPGSGLPHTGSVVATWAVWMGGSLIALGLIALAIVAWARKVRES